MLSKVVFFKNILLLLLVLMLLMLLLVLVLLLLLPLWLLLVLVLLLLLLLLFLVLFVLLVLCCWCYRTDHSLISLKVILTNQQKCNTYWTFNNSLFGDKDYARIVKEGIFNVVQQYAATGSLR